MRQTHFFVALGGVRPDTVLFDFHDRLCLATQPSELSAQVLDCHNRETFDTNFTSSSTDYWISESLLVQNSEF